MADPLAVLARLRQLGADQARRQLASALREEATTEHLATTRAEALRTGLSLMRMAEAPVPSGPWLAVAQEATRAASAARAAAAETADARRTALAEARAAERAVETVRALRAEAARVARARAEQGRLDEFRRT